MTRLAGYRHGDRNAFGVGVKTRFRSIVRDAIDSGVCIIYCDAPQRFRAEGQLEELDWFVRELDREFLGPIADCSEIKFTLCTNGLAFRYSTEESVDNHWPFDERVLEEKEIPRRDLWTIVEEGILLS